LFLCFEEIGVLTSEILQNTCLTAFGRLFLGFSVSAAARPTSSVPLNANAAVTKTEQRPLKPLWNAPGWCQFLPPMYSPLGPPPQSRMIPRMLFLFSHCSSRSFVLVERIWKSYINPTMATTFTIEK